MKPLLILTLVLISSPAMADMTCLSFGEGVVITKCHEDPPLRYQPPVQVSRPHFIQTEYDKCRKQVEVEMVDSKWQDAKTPAFRHYACMWAMTETRSFTTSEVLNACTTSVMAETDTPRAKTRAGCAKGHKWMKDLMAKLRAAQR